MTKKYPYQKTVKSNETTSMPSISCHKFTRSTGHNSENAGYLKFDEDAPCLRYLFGRVFHRIY
jgi:hypothetical protein